MPEVRRGALTRSGAGSRLLSVAGGPSVRGVRVPDEAAAVAVRPSLHPSRLQFAPPPAYLPVVLPPSHHPTNRTYVHRKCRQENTPHYDDGNKSRPAVTWRCTQRPCVCVCAGAGCFSRPNFFLPTQSVSLVCILLFCPVHHISTNAIANLLTEMRTLRRQSYATLTTLTRLKIGQRAFESTRRVCIFTTNVSDYIDTVSAFIYG